MTHTYTIVNLTIAVDFDGTVVGFAYPEIGRPIPLALNVLKECMKLGDRIILYTMRSGKELDEAAEYMRSNGIELWGINTNPHQNTWTESPKAHADIYIDDQAAGCPLLYRPDVSARPVVDWKEIRMILDRRRRNLY